MGPCSGEEGWNIQYLRTARKLEGDECQLLNKFRSNGFFIKKKKHGKINGNI